MAGCRSKRGTAPGAAAPSKTPAKNRKAAPLPFDRKLVRVKLESFIVSNTASHEMRKQWSIDKAEMSRRHILFQGEDRDTYIGTLLRRAVGSAT